MDADPDRVGSASFWTGSVLVTPISLRRLGEGLNNRYGLTLL